MTEARSHLPGPTSASSVNSSSVIHGELEWGDGATNGDGTGLLASNAKAGDWGYTGRTATNPDTLLPEEEEKSNNISAASCGVVAPLRGTDPLAGGFIQESAPFLSSELPFGAGNPFAMSVLKSNGIKGNDPG